MCVKTGMVLGVRKGVNVTSGKKREEKGLRVVKKVDSRIKGKG